ncbi:MAG: AAA family ATPase [Desulfobulbaceae bacterium]|nr:AAA family ATPase [Desulfobulbaceae bacterium]
MKNMNHLSFFGFTDNPFRLTPDRDFFFPSANHTAVGDVIKFGLEMGDGFIIVTGEVGTGKTILLRWVLSDLSKEFETAILLSPLLMPKGLLLAILRDAGYEEKIDNKASLDHLLRTLNDYLFEISKKNRQFVVVIDEAQNLPAASIEQLRLLSNFESDKKKLLQIVLVGQPELKAKIEKPNLRQLLQRVTIMETLNPLPEKETIQYVHFRFSKAGRGDMRLSRRTCRELWKMTKGVPRQINKLMSRALLISFSEQKQAIDYKTLRKAGSSLNMSTGSKSPWRFWRQLVFGAVLFAVSFAMLFASTAGHDSLASRIHKTGFQIASLTSLKSK